MAKAFKNIKDPKLGMFDILLFGKYSKCRIVDIIAVDWEYLIWLDKNTSIKFTDDVVTELKRKFQGYEDQRHYEEEIRPWEDYEDRPWEDYDADIPF